MNITHKYNIKHYNLPTKQDINLIITQLKKSYPDPHFDWNYDLIITYDPSQFYYDTEDCDHQYDSTKTIEIEFSFTVIESEISIQAYTDKYFNLISSTLIED